MIKKLFRRFMMPECHEVAVVLQSYLDGELPPSKTHVVEEHLEHCERCGIERDIYVEVKRSLQQLGTPPDPAAVERLRAYADGLAGDDTA